MRSFHVIRRSALTWMTLMLTGCAARTDSTPRSGTSTDEQFVTRAELRTAIDSIWSDPKSESLLAVLLSQATTVPADPTDFSKLQKADQAAERLATVVRAIDEAMRIVSENLANAETLGFKAKSVQFGPEGQLIVRPDMMQGPLVATHRSLDVAIRGDGFLCVKRLSNQATSSGRSGDLFYTRNGSFFANDQGFLVLGLGDSYQLEPPIALPNNLTQVAVADDGTISGVSVDWPTRTVIGRISIATFRNASALTQVGGVLFEANDASGRARIHNSEEDDAGLLVTGYLEGSNVDLTREQLKFAMLARWRASVDRAIQSAMSAASR